jgi:hypothetical protein
MRSTPKMVWQARTQEEGRKDNPHRLGDERKQKILKEREIE